MVKERGFPTFTPSHHQHQIPHNTHDSDTDEDDEEEEVELGDEVDTIKYHQLSN